MVYAITYDLNKPGQEYARLYETIKTLGTWWHYLDSTWLVDTQLDAEEIAHRLHSNMDASDNLLVIEVKNHWYAYLGPRARDWLHQHL